MSNIIQTQKTLEEEMVALGIKRYRDELHKAKKGSFESSTPAGVHLLRKGINRVERAIIKLKDQYRNGEPLPYTVSAVEKIFLLPTDVLAFITLKTCINFLSVPTRLVKVASEVGSLVEDEVRLGEFKNAMPKYYKAIVRDLNDKSTSYRHQKRSLVHASIKQGVSWENWKPTLKVRLGQLLVQLVCDETKLFETKLQTLMTQERKHTYMVTPTDKTLEWVKSKNSICELLNPVKLPTVIPPKPWTSLFSGGYYVYDKMCLVKTKDESYLNQLKDLDLTKVFKAVNVVQDTAWRVNSSVMAVMASLYSSESDSPVIPTFLEKRMAEAFPTGEPSEELTAKIKKWKLKSLLIHKENIRKKTKRIQFAQFMWMVNKFKDSEKFYFPHNIDFRGRLYASTAFLNPQGDDAARGVLEFHEGKQLNTESAFRWLKIHGANCYGMDKVSLDDRVRWAEKNMEFCLECAENPLEYTWWMQADKPWQFLRYCFEIYHKPLRSHLPITVDGSCNGLQHFSAMLKDTEGARAVNLLPSREPNDVYQIVCDKVNEQLADDDNPLAESWANDVKRKIIKRPVMTTPYGVTLYGIKEQIHQELTKQLDEGVEYKNITKETDLWPYCMYLGNQTYKAIGDIVVSARKGMKWLQSIASMAGKKDQWLYWYLPSGFMVKQRYSKAIVRTVKTTICGKLSYLFVAVAMNDKLDKHKQINGIAPNFVHSYDACHLMLSVTEARERGINSFSVVHDSFGTHDCDIEKLGIILREKFIEIYREDVLLNFKNEVNAQIDGDIPDPPTFGDLDIEEVRNAQFFFS